MTTDIESQVKEFIVREFLHGDAEGLDNETQLMEIGVLDSISTVTLIAHLEKTFSVKIMPVDINPDNLGSIKSIAAFIGRKTK